MTNTLHAHVSRATADCDGPQESTYVDSFNEEEIAESQREFNDFSEITFMNRVFTNVAGPYAVLSARIEITEEGFTYDEQTEEGYRHASVYWCHRDCDTEQRTYRDVFAESAGY